MGNMFEAGFTALQGTEVPALPETIETIIQSMNDARSRHAAAEAAAHTPDTEDGPITLPPLRALAAGCYRMSFTPGTIAALRWYAGTLRVEKPTLTSTIASGDLYQRQLVLVPTVVDPGPPVVLRGGTPQVPTDALEETDDAGVIPIYPRADYRYYLRVTQILQGFTTSGGFNMVFERFRFSPTGTMWTSEGLFTAKLAWTAGGDIQGDVFNSANVKVGRLSLTWVSPYLRRATVEIDRVSVSEAPLDNGLGLDWRGVFDKVGWDITVLQSSASIVEPSGPGWSDAEMHAAMLANRDMNNLNAEWRYHVLCVRIIDSTPRGVMYDAFATDSNKVPREGLGISSHWVIPNANPWGKVKGLRFGTAKAPYFRTVIHEIGHAMGLFHNTVDKGFMNTTDVIAAAAVPPTQFPDNIKWQHAPDDQKRLRHMPDPLVRPGGQPFGTSYFLDEAVTPEELELVVQPLMPSVPIGAPVRVGFTLTNRGTTAIPVPQRLNMKAGAMKGAVTAPSGRVRLFVPLIHCVDDEPLELLQPGESKSHSVTLLRGPDGALFPSPGLHEVEIKVTWHMGRDDYEVAGRANVMISGVVDEAHGAAANTVLSSPDAHLVLAIGGDHLHEGIAAIGEALANPVLRRHYGVTEARRMGKRFGKRKPDMKAFAEALDDDTVMSGAELTRLVEIAKAASKDMDTAAGKRCVKMLNKHADALGDDASKRSLKAM